MNVSDSQVFFKRPRHSVAQQWAERPAPGRPVLAKEVRVWVHHVFRCHLHDTTNRFANSLVDIPQAG